VLALLYATSGEETRAVETWICSRADFRVLFGLRFAFGGVCNLRHRLSYHFEVFTCHDVFDGFSFLCSLLQKQINQKIAQLASFILLLQ
jgi:hypothetical protein